MIIHVINLLERTDRLVSIKNIFKEHPKFKLNIIEAVRDEVGTQGLFKSFKKIIRNNINNDYIIICEDDHIFTNDFNFNSLRDNILKSKNMGCDILLGGPSYFQDGFFLDENLMCVTKFTGLQFTVIFKKFYRTFLSYELSVGTDLDLMLFTISERIFAIYPPISSQKNFGYSDVTKKNNNISVEDYFINSSIRMTSIFKVSKYYDII